eukprot:PhF_6_TR26009/c0_g1_i1/m.36654
MMNRMGIRLTEVWRLKELLRTLKQAMLHEVPKKAPILVDKEIKKLLRVRSESFVVPLAFMLPVGLRFQDATRIKKKDVTILGNTMTIRVREAKNIRERGKQRWLSVRIPDSYVPVVLKRWKECREGDALVNVTYGSFQSGHNILLTTNCLEP